jgi:hypothetical protein
MIEFDMDFEELGIQVGEEWTAGLFDGTAHCIATDDDELIVVDISLDLSRLNQKARGYDRESRMLDRTKPAERVLFHQLKDALYVTHEDHMADAALDAGWKPYTDFPYHSNQAGRTL